jgi:hypothetical protein
MLIRIHGTALNQCSGSAELWRLILIQIFSSVAVKMPSFCLIFFLAVFRTVETFTRTSIFKDQVFPHFLLSTGTHDTYLL